MADGLARAMQEPHTMLDVLLTSADSADAVASLQARLDLTWLQARVVMDAQFRQATERERLLIETERAELEQHLAYLKGLESG